MPFINPLTISHSAVALVYAAKEVFSALSDENERVSHARRSSPKAIDEAKERAKNRAEDRLNWPANTSHRRATNPRH
jgi:vacuolar-type H+-ATPase subunit H